MGRGRVQLRRIENKVNRQVTFSKRRSGLLKKAHEISVLCEADVAVIVFSAKGKLYEYSTNSNMGRILDRYEQYFYAEKEVLGPDSEQGENSIEFSKMKFRIESLQRTQRQLMGGDLESLNVTELQHLEQQLENALRKVRSRKNCMLLDSIAELEKKEILLHEKNIALEKEVKEMKEALAQTAHSRKENPRSKNNSALYLCLNDDPPTEPTVNTGTNPVTEQPIAEDQQNETEACTSNQLPRWMLCHVNRAG